MVRLEGIRKYFAATGVEALAGADFELRRGEVHALVGENGAGKSTLMHIMAGSLEPGGGTIRGATGVLRFHAPADALQAGIGMVRQHPRVIPGFRLWEECVLGAEPGAGGWVDRRRARSLVHEASCRWGFDLDADRQTTDLTVSQRQKAAVLSLLLRGVDFLILDEPTAVLTPAETARLFDLLARLRSEGRGIALISHKLTETLGLADRVTVLRQGKTLTTLPAADIDGPALSALMFAAAPTGNETSPPGPPMENEIPAVRLPTTADGATAASCPPALRVRNLSVQAPGKPFIRSVDLEVAPGRIMGIAGVRDSGLETLELAVTGLVGCRTGSIEVAGKRTEGQGARGFRKAGGAYLCADRLGTALARRLPLRDSLVVHVHRRYPVMLDRRALNAWALRLMAEARVNASPLRSAESFSGGMLQRALLAREFAEKSALLVLAEPGSGLDTLGKRELADQLRRYVRSGGAVLLFSTDVDELLSLCDDVCVLRDGSVAARYALGGAPREALREAIGSAMIGAEVCVDV